MLRVMLRATSHDVARNAAHDAAHDVLQPRLPNLECPLLKNSLVHICEQLLAILAAEVYFAYYLNRASALRAHVAIYDFAAGAAGMHFMYNLDLRVASLMPWERTSYTHTKLQLCSWSSGAHFA